MLGRERKKDGSQRPKRGEQGNTPSGRFKDRSGRALTECGRTFRGGGGGGMAEKGKTGGKNERIRIKKKRAFPGKGRGE